MNFVIHEANGDKRKKIKVLFFLKITSLKLKALCVLFCIFITHFSSSRDRPEQVTDSVRGTASQKRDLPKSIQKLRDNLYNVGFIASSYASHEGNESFIATPDHIAVNKVFNEECQQNYTNFSNNRKTFLRYISNPSNSETPQNLTEKINLSIKACIHRIYKKYQELNPFIESINKDYYANKLSSGYIEYLDFHATNKRILKITGTQKSNFNTIKKELKDYLEFQDKCVTKIVGLQVEWNPESLDESAPYQDSIPSPQSYIKLRDFFKQKVKNGINCYKQRNHFIKTFNNDIFKRFKQLPGQCKDTSGCVGEIQKQLEPPYPKENEGNLFNQCKKEIDKAYTDCFGEASKRDELQEALHLIDHKSPAVCEENRLAKAREAQQKCIQAINKCMKECDNTITSFKKEFLQCFFLPNFDPHSYKTLHGAEINNCSNKIEELEKNFQIQAKKEPFNDKNPPSFHSLEHPNNDQSSIAHYIIKACEIPLKSRQIDKKIAEMEQICQHRDTNKQQENQQENLFNDPATTSYSPSGSSNRNSSGSSSRSSNGPGSIPFSYGSNNNQSFNYNKDLQTEEKNSEVDSYQIPDPHSNTLPSLNDDKSDKSSISADFKNSETVDPNSPQSYSSPDSSALPLRSPSSMKYSPSLGGAGNLSFDATDMAGDKSETWGSKVNKSIRNFLSSEASYGAIDDRTYSGSATQNFLDWINDKKNKAKKAVLNTYDGIVGVDRAEFQRKLHLNNEYVNLFNLQKEMFIEACKTHNCAGAGASPEVQTQSQ